MEEASEDFRKLVPGGGAPSLTCNCGRTHYSGQYEAEESEWKQLREEEREYPDRVQIWEEVDGISCSELNGMIFVDGCECGQLAKYENFIWENRILIMMYITHRANENLQTAKNENDELKEFQNKKIL